MSSRFILCCKEKLDSVSDRGIPLLFSGIIVELQMQLKKIFFTLLFQTTKIYFCTAGILFFFLIFSAFLHTILFLSYGLVLWPVFSQQWSSELELQEGSQIEICLSSQKTPKSFIHVHKDPNFILLDGHILNLLFFSLNFLSVFNSVLSRVLAKSPLKNPEADFYKRIHWAALSIMHFFFQIVFL